MRALMQRCRAWIPDFRTVNFLNLSQSSERPGRAAAHYPQNKTPQLAGFCHSAHRTAGIGGIGAIRASLMNVSRVSFGEVQRSLAGIKSYAQVACAELFRISPSPPGRVRASWNSAGFGRTKFAAVIRGGSPEGQCGLPHAPDVRIDEVQRSLYWFVVFVLCNLANLACHRL